MKIKNIDLVRISNVLEEYSTYKLPQRISYAITKNMINLSNDVKCYTESLNKIVSGYKEYFVKDNNGEISYNAMGVPNVDDEHNSEYLKEIHELLKIDIDISLYTIPIDIFDYNDDKYDALSALDLIKLQKILCNENDGESNEKDE